jgi:hypothetical protein
MSVFRKQDKTRRLFTRTSECRIAGRCRPERREWRRWARPARQRAGVIGPEGKVGGLASAAGMNPEGADHGSSTMAHGVHGRSGVRETVVESRLLGGSTAALSGHTTGAPWGHRCRLQDVAAQPGRVRASVVIQGQRAAGSGQDMSPGRLARPCREIDVLRTVGSRCDGEPELSQLPVAVLVPNSTERAASAGPFAAVQHACPEHCDSSLLACLPPPAAARPLSPGVMR